MSAQDSDKRIVLDTYAWIEYFKGSQEGLKAKKFIENKFELFTPSIVVAELSDKYRRDKIPEWAIRKRFVKLKSKIILLDDDIADLAGRLKQELRKEHKDIGIVDSIILAHSLTINARILTGDQHLKNLRNSIDVAK